VEIHDPGQSDYEVGQRITIVTADDPDGLAPRAFLRHRVLVGVANELAGVASIKVWYPYIPEPTAPDENGSREVEIPDPHSELLVVDLARDFARKTISIAPETRAAIVAALNDEEAPMLAEWIAHVRGYAPLETRFAR